MELLPTVEGKPPAPRPIRLSERWRVTWHGRRDARRLPLDNDVPPPYLETLRAEAEAAHRMVTGWVHRHIVPIDREAVELLTLLEQHRRAPLPEPPPLVPRPASDHTDPRPNFAIPAWVIEARQVAAARREYQRHLTELRTAEQRLGRLGSMRHHLVETARAAVGAHTARYEQLVGLYCAALLRRQPQRDLTTAGYRPRALTTESWVHGDLPLLALELDGELAERYRWFLKEFASRTSAAPHPVPVEIPRAG